MRQLDKIRKMSTDEMTTSLVRILTCKRCFCYDLCQKLKATNGADGKAPCAVAIRQFLESEAADEKPKKRKKTALKG